MVHGPTILTVLKLLTLVLGGLITYYAFKAYRRTGARALGALSVGFGTITAGGLVAGVIDQVTAFDINVALIVEGAFTVVGFAIILYSLYAR